jgi:hypothetical protein
MAPVQNLLKFKTPGFNPKAVFKALLWVKPDLIKRAKLLKLIDQINQERGRGTVRMASVGIN